jgi:hypothetical protein
LYDIILSAIDTNINPAKYIAELKIEFEDGTITKSEELSSEIRRAVIN